MIQVAPAVDALKKMAAALENDLKSLLTYFGENPSSPEAPKPEDFFALVCSFSSSLQVCTFTHSPLASITPLRAINRKLL
jgi:diaphanous 1